MKTILTRLLALSGIALLMLQGCKKSDVLVTANSGQAGTLRSSSTTLVLKKASLNDTTKVINFAFTQANYGYSGASVTNTLQIDKAGDNWANPISTTLAAKVLSQGYNTADFNNLLLKLGLVGGTSASINVRISQSISSSVTPIYSNIVAMTVTPFNLTSWLYVVGDYQGWNATSPDSLLSATSNGVYQGIINFASGNQQFLILPAKNFSNKYATSTSTVPTASVTYNAGNNLNAPVAFGQYIVTLNLNTNTITFALANLYSVIGSTTPGGDFSTDIDFKKYVNDGVTGWTGTFAFTNGTFPGTFKVRQNHDWTYSWGVPKSGSDGFGVAATLNDSSNDNIPITVSGSYTVSFNIGLTAIGATPPVTATYNVVKQ